MGKVKRSAPLLWPRRVAGIMKQITASVATAVMLGLSSQSYGAEAVELADVEHYIADGQQFEVRKILGEISVKFQDDKGTVEAAGDWASASAKPVEVLRSLARGAIVYRVSDDSPGGQVARETMDLLQSDETVRYAYPM